ncbi:MAG: SseB family protein [Proteobacteria bacterium]|nr:SseB family protein [Pseudomonadota bacterium]MCP4920967.1 SseB family protein [Pseudomonadota bacterium]
MTLHEALTQLPTAGGDHNRLVIQGGRGWFVVHGAKHVDEVEVEAAASHYLDEPLALESVAHLRHAGFASRPRSRTLARRGPVEGLAEELTSLMKQVYGDAEVTLSMTLGDREPTQNPVLLEAIRVLSKDRDMPARHQLYRRLMDATLLFASEDGVGRAFGDLSGTRVVGVFSDWDELSWFEPRGLPYVRISGRDLIKKLVEEPDVGSLLINPKGRVGGELYRNELQTIRSAIRG